MNRRTFVEALTALCMTTNARLLLGKGVLSRPVATDFDGRSDLTHDLVPIPVYVDKVHNPVVNLAGEWHVNPNPTTDLWENVPSNSSWTKIPVPSELAALGVQVTPNFEYPLRRSLQVPSDFANQRVFLRFDSVYSYARVWVNGTLVREHFGGFTAWDCEITDLVKAGESADLVVGVTDRSDDISQGSYYAKHSIAGILRNVRLFAVPRSFLRSLSTSVTLDKEYKNGSIHIEAHLSAANLNAARLELSLTDDLGRPVDLQPRTLSTAVAAGVVKADIVVPSPKHWDAEHPNLYTLEVALVDGTTVTQKIQKRIGFRTVERSGNQLLVNGRPIKLRGVCRHSIHPIHGRAAPSEFDELDAKLFRAANVNFIRTSHYPPSEQFLDTCDKYGLYVEEETAVSWSNEEQGPSSDPEFQSRFLGQFAEMIARDRHRASVIFWSLGNESHWGTNFALEHRFAAEHDPTRPTIFSYSETAPLPQSFDIYSKHYASVNADLGSSTWPILHDEFAHVACYNLPTLRRDPGVRAFWGRSIKQFGEKFISSEGCLGGSIWAGIDEVFLLPDGPVGYGPWGVIDGWRREKPEYWLTKKAYSPIRIADESVPAPASGENLIIPIRNAFDHTNLNEIEIHWTCGSASGRVAPVNLAPHESGYLEIPGQALRPGGILQLDFVAHEGLFAQLGQLDQFRLPIQATQPSTPPSSPAPASLQSIGDRILVTGQRFSIAFSRTTGLIVEARFDNHLVLQGGPYVDLGGGPLTDHWLLRSFAATVDGPIVQIRTTGECKLGEGIETIPVEFDIEIDGSGLIRTLYRLRSEKQGNPQIGIAYLLPSDVEKFAWKRSPLWSVYPPDHIARPQGVALKHPNHPKLTYRAKPEWPWAEDIGDSFLYGKENAAAQASNDFISLKENIWYAACIFTGGNIRVRAESDAELAARAAVLPDGRIAFSLYNFWQYPDLEWGNYTGPNSSPAMTTHEVRLRLTDILEEA